MWAQKLNFIPPNVAVWLRDIRKVPEFCEESYGNAGNCESPRKENSSNDSIYDNVILSLEKFKETSVTSPVKKNFKTDLYPTWPLGRYPAGPRPQSLRDVLEIPFEEDESRRKTHVNCLNSKPSCVKYELRTSDIICGRRDLAQSLPQEGEEPKLCASMSNKLATDRVCAWTWLHAEEIIPDDRRCFYKVLNNAENDVLNIENKMTFGRFGEKSAPKVNESLVNFKSRESKSSRYKKALPIDFDPVCSFILSGILDSEFVTEKPPVPPKRKKHRMSQRRFPRVSVSQGRGLQKNHFANAKLAPLPSVLVSSKAKNSNLDMLTLSRSGNDDDEISLIESISSRQDKITDNTLNKPLPFPAYDPKLEYEISELLMMQRVTESSKERRRISVDSKTYPISEEFIDSFQGCIKNIPEAPQGLPGAQPLSELLAEKVCGHNLSKLTFNLPDEVVDVESQNKVQQFLNSRKKKIKFETKPEVPPKLREDIIIDWENAFENLSEPVVLEGKSIVLRRLRPEIKVSTESDCSETDTLSDCLKVKEEEKSDCCDTLSTDEVCSGVTDVSLASQINMSFDERQEGATNPRKFASANFGSKVTNIVVRYDKILKETDLKCDTEVFDKMSLSSISDGLNSYSDFESDINETIAAAEMWFNEKPTEENFSIISWDGSEDLSRSSNKLADVFDDNESSEKDCLRHSNLYTTRMEHIFSNFQTLPLNFFSEGRFNFIAEDEGNLKEERNVPELMEERVESRNLLVKSFSDTNLRRGVELKKHLSKSLDFFRDSLTENRLKEKITRENRVSMTSDVCEWMAVIRGIALAEDQCTNNDEWILSFDSEERAYFFEETSKKSLWTLPDYSRESEKPENNFSIQRSVTEGAINNEALTKLRLKKDGNESRISASTRSSKAQSMLIEPKLDSSPKDGGRTFSIPKDLSKIYGEILRIGVLNKTKILENGKKLRKNWTPSFVVLTESHLFFFKDAKSFQNMKSVIGSSGNLMCLNLQGAVIEKGDKISSRKNVYKISCLDNTNVLIQTDKTSEAEEWFKKINCVIENVPQDLNALKGSPVLDSKSSLKVGRAKSLKVRSKDTGSMEDLSSTAEERQNKIKARLKKFFIRRPTVDSLKKKGIWKDEPVFGCSLEQITKNRNPRVPEFVVKCIECIENKEENMKTDGLYRASGNLSQVQKIRLEVDQNNLNIMKEEEDVHVLTGSLKLFFRELKEPLVPSKQLEPALLATDKQSRKEKIKDFQKIVKSLPTPNYDTLKFLLQHLLRVKEYHKYNRMNINNLAIVFGPTLMWPEQESANMALELMQQNVVIECLLKEFQEIFT